MSILAVGALWLPYIRDNWFDALRRTLGDGVRCVNAGPLLQARNRHSVSHEGYLGDYLFEELRRVRCDFLFCYEDWMENTLADAFFEKVRSTGVRTVAFHPDDEPERWYARNRVRDHRFDIIASHSLAATARRRSAGWGERALHLPWGFNPRYCRRLEVEQDYDVVFIGKHKVDPARRGLFCEDGSQRESVLVRLAEACKRKGWRFGLFGFGWETHPVLREHSKGIPGPQDLNEVICRARIVFNPAWSADGDETGVQTKLRHFEVPGCGAFQITNQNPELASLYTADREIVFYATTDELLDKVSYYLTHDRARRQIADAGYARSLSEHTLDHRVNTLFSEARRVFDIPSPRGSNLVPDQVTTLQLRGMSRLRDIATLIPTDAKWIHVVAGDFAEVRVDYSSLAEHMRRLPGVILSVLTYAFHSGRATNPIQPSLSDIDCALIGSTVDEYGLSFGPAGPCGSGFVGVTDNSQHHLVINYIVPRSRFEEFSEAFDSGSISAIERLNAVPTGRLVTEVEYSSDVVADPTRGPFLAEAKYLVAARKVLEVAAAQRLRVVLYGVSGMGAVVLQDAAGLPGFRFAGVVDRSLDTSLFDGIPVISLEDLKCGVADIVLLAAFASGPDIYANLATVEAHTCVLPLYDLRHAAWSFYAQ